MKAFGINSFVESLKQKQILLLCQENDFFLLIKVYLDKQNFSYKHLHHPKEGYDYIVKRLPEVIITDTMFSKVAHDACQACVNYSPAIYLDDNQQQKTYYELL